MPEAPRPETLIPTNNDNQAVQKEVSSLEAAIAAVEGQSAPTAQPQGETTSTIEPAAPADQPAADPKAESAKLIAAAKEAQAARRKAKALEAQLADQAKAAEAEKARLEAERAELENLMKGISTPKGLNALLAKAGLDFDTLARAGLGIEPQAEDPASVAARKVEALEKKLSLIHI